MQRVWLASLKFGSQTDVATIEPTSEPNLRLTIVNALRNDPGHCQEKHILSSSVWATLRGGDQDSVLVAKEKGFAWKNGYYVSSSEVNGRKLFFQENYFDLNGERCFIICEEMK